MQGRARGPGDGWPPLRPGDVVAVDLAPGERWPAVLDRAWAVGAALLPVDHRLPASARRDLLSRARPTVMVSEEGARRMPSGLPCDPSVALMVATSGSTGGPRLVELTRRAVEAAVSASLRSLDAGSEDGWVSCLPLSHIGGLLVLLRGLLAGVPVLFRGSAGPVPAPGFRFVSAVPTQLVRALDAGVDLRAYRAMLIGGGGMEPALRERAAAAGAPCVVTYGLTQSCGGVVYDGVPLPGVRVRVSGAGEIELGGPTLMRGYREEGDPPTAQGDAGGAAVSGDLTPDGWLRTGDAGWMDDAGLLHVQGRIDDLIVTGGEKVWPGDVEAVLRAHPGVAECAVFGRAHPEWGEEVVAAVVPRDPAAPPALAELRNRVGETLGRHRAPRALLIVESLPRTPLGKVQRAALRSLPTAEPRPRA